MVKIDSTSFGEIVIDNKTYYSDMTVWWDGKTEYRDKSHVIDMSEFVKIMKRGPTTGVGSISLYLGGENILTRDSKGFAHGGLSILVGGSSPSGSSKIVTTFFPVAFSQRV